MVYLLHQHPQIIDFTKTIFNNYDNALDLGINSWDYNSKGNYWDDYNDYDTDGNGIGDNPYTIDGGSSNIDHFL